MICSLNEDIKIELDWLALGENAIEVLFGFIEGVNTEEKSMFYVDCNGKFYFVVSHTFDLEKFTEITGNLIVDKVIYNDQFTVGFGIHSLEKMKCRLCYNLTDDEYKIVGDVLDFTFFCTKPNTFYPGTKVFQRDFIEGGYKCYALYPYTPINRKRKVMIPERAIRNFVFKFKDGLCPELAARYMFLATECEKDIPVKDENTVIIPIPASTDEVHQKRFGTFCKELARLLEVTDGFPFLELTMDRDENDIKKGMPLSNVMKLRSDVDLTGKRVIVVDDVFTSGTSFRQIANYLMLAGAKSVMGLFISKTI